MFENKDIKMGEKFYFRTGLSNERTNRYIKVTSSSTFSFEETSIEFNSILGAFRYFSENLNIPCSIMSNGYANFENKEGYSFNVYYNIAKYNHDNEENKKKETRILEKLQDEISYNRNSEEISKYKKKLIDIYKNYIPCPICKYSLQIQNNLICGEIHHIKPLKLGKDFNEKNNIDHSGNLICICSNCHKEIHFFEKDLKESERNKLFELKLLLDKNKTS